MAAALIPKRLSAYFDAVAYDDAVRIKCKAGHVEHGKLGEEDEILTRLYVQSPGCRFCRKAYGP